MLKSKSNKTSGLQCQTSIRLKVVIRFIWALFEPKNLFEQKFLFVNLNILYLNLLPIFFGPQHFSRVTKEIFYTPSFLDQNCFRLNTFFLLISFFDLKFWTKNCGSKYLFMIQYFFGPQILLSQLCKPKKR